MKTVNHNYKKQFLLTSLLLTLGVNAWAGATFDGTMGSNTSTISGDFAVTEADGTLSGSNLFHSFSSFNINSGESATFTGTSPINNVLSRVTGAESSTFNGALTSEITGANFYFINPNGIVFKEGASINVDGSFYATTSDYVKLGTDGIFYADTSATNILTSTPPSSFGFLDSNVGTITFQGAQLVEGINLSIPDGATFAVIGGDINFQEATEGSATLIGGFGVPNSTGSLISLQGNQFDIVSIASAGEVVPVSGGYDLSSFTMLGNVSIAGGSIIDANEVYIRGGNVVIENSMIAPGYMSLLFGLPQANGGTIDIAATNQFSITASAPMNTFYSNALSVPGGGSFLAGITTFGGVTTPDAAAITIDALNIALSGSVEIKSLIQGSDDPAAYNIAGNINLTATNSVSLTDSASIKSTIFGTKYFSNAADINIYSDKISISNNASIIGSRKAYGNAGNILLAGNIIEVINGGIVANTNSFYGDGGNITIDANQVILDGQDTTSVAGTGLSTLSYFNSKFSPNGSGLTDIDYLRASANAGNIFINVNNELNIKNGAYISAESRSLGNGGNIDITAKDINLSRDGKVNGSIASQSVLAGNSGNIVINATGDININSGFEISATTAGTGNGGNISITAGNTISITGENSGIASATPEPTSLVKDDLAKIYGAPNFEILISLLNAYFGANLDPNANMFTVMAALEEHQLLPLNDLSPSAGNAGSISLDASTLVMNDLSRITSSTTSDGNGGTINIQVDKLEMAKGAEIRSRSGLYNQTTGLLEVGAGNGGDISILAQESVSMKSGSSISSSSLGDGLAGNILLNAGDALKMINSSITTEATVSDGGNITIIAEKEIYLDQSDITTSVESGLGSGGNIDIDPDFFILRGSNILANAYGGDGGNIDLVAKHFITSADSSIDASSALGMDGEVNMSSPAEDVSDDLAVLPDNYLDVTNLISERCGSSSGSSSLVDVGSSGIAVDPDGYLPSFAVAENITNANNIKNTASSQNKQWSKAYIDQSELSLSQLACSAI